MMNKYKVTYLTKVQCKKFIEVIEAESPEAVRNQIKRYACQIEIELAKDTDKNIDGIIDAEELLFEMDANNTNVLSQKEGFKTVRAVTRKQVMNSISIK